MIIQPLRKERGVAFTTCLQGKKAHFPVFLSACRRRLRDVVSRCIEDVVSSGPPQAMRRRREQERGNQPKQQCARTPSKTLSLPRSSAQSMRCGHWRWNGKRAIPRNRCSLRTKPQGGGSTGWVLQTIGTSGPALTRLPPRGSFCNREAQHQHLQRDRLRTRPRPKTNPIAASCSLLHWHRPPASAQAPNCLDGSLSIIKPPPITN